MGNCFDSSCATPIPATSSLADACDPYKITVFPEDNIIYNWLILILLGIVYRLIASVILVYRFSRFNISKATLTGDEVKRREMGDQYELEIIDKALIGENFVNKNPTSRKL